MVWSLYILECGDRYYTGISTDPVRRLSEHHARDRRAARFTRAFPAGRMVYCVTLGSRSLATRAEARVKKLSRRQKERLITECVCRDALLAELGLAAESVA